MTKNINQKKLIPNNSFLGVFTVQKDGKIKMEKAKLYEKINQYKTHWKPINSRNAMRVINRSKLIIK
jgi:hypothetical protein